MPSVSFVVSRLRHPVDFGRLALWRIMAWPRQSWGEIQFVCDELRSRPRPRVFEWGIGASTVWYTRWLRRQGHPFDWHGVEHDPGWYQAVRGRTDPERVHLDCVPFQWEPRYDPIAEPYIQAPRDRGLFDLLIIDGRYRRRCLEVAMDCVAPGGLVMLCDVYRQYYHCGLHQYGGRLVTFGRIPGRLSTTPTYTTWLSR